MYFYEINSSYINLNFLFNSGKNPKWKYYLSNIMLNSLPNFIFRRQYQKLITDFNSRSDKDYILERVNYYNKLEQKNSLPLHAKQLKENKIEKAGSVYYYDTEFITRYFSPTLNFFTCYGDITHIPNEPSILKSRPIVGNNENSVLLNLDKVRHFIFLRDKKKFEEKTNKAIFRGKIIGKQQRINFMNIFFENTLFDIGDVSKHITKPEWKVPKKTLWQHLDYKFIMALEGNDVASNLKWVMSSNSIAVMPKPTYETWFMEGKLIPDFHYIEVDADFSNLEQKLNYYIENPSEANQIIRNANTYCKQFYDSKREKIIGLLVMKKYFEKTNQI
ncbi:lipopolysaccharide biosynthesis protein [Flavobacterium davisii]|uniref:Lipopolysaccharide biosynthesis protein n=1 Tax=Flavobacterium davisii TaxID=2906077 RepID=A0A246GKQ9_9FLAO|nr:glycosyl transferase family 90 [Flavobacterium davisii]OWP84778.1 lipopolysaccharide biosynthesis protein [Flavobacterium davisii]